MNAKRATWLEPVEGCEGSGAEVPHLQMPGAVYLVTFRVVRKVHLSPDERDLVAASIRFLDGRKYRLIAAVIMPDHVHLLIQPMRKGEGVHSLAEIMHSLKSYTAHQIGGPVWQRDYWDEIMRDFAHQCRTVDYVKRNPVTRGLVGRSEQYRWLLLGDERQAQSAGPQYRR